MNFFNGQHVPVENNSDLHIALLSCTWKRSDGVYGFKVVRVSDSLALLEFCKLS